MGFIDENALMSVGKGKDELLPCPFVGLGGPHKLHINSNRGYVMVICGCGARGPSNYSKESAIDAWNNRTNFGG